MQAETTAREFRRNRIKTLKEQGLTRSQIAERMGMTKGQVDGVVHKLNVANLAANGADLKFIAPRVGQRNQPSPPAVLTEILPVEVSFDPPDGKINVYNARAMQCRWIDEDGYFCGNVTTRPSSSYCSHHHSLCWTKPNRIGARHGAR